MRFRVGFRAAIVLVLAAAPMRAQIEVAEELIVDLDAGHPTAGEDVWEGGGTVGNFTRVGDAFATEIDGVFAVMFNEAGQTDAYQSELTAPAGIVGLDPTRSIEVWAWNPLIDGEETLVAWGKRGGGNGTNMSFNYGTNGAFGAVGHWGGPDIGWNNAGGAPTEGMWHHLAYTFDGTTTRVYADGQLANSEVLGAGVINTHAGTKINIASQLDADGVTLTGNLRGSLAIARVRVHDGVLSEDQIFNNFRTEAEEFGILEQFLEPPAFVGTPDEDSGFAGAEYSRQFSVTGSPPPTVTLVEPAFGALTDLGGGVYEVSFAIPANPPASIEVTITAENTEGEEDASWSVLTRSLPPAGQLAIAGELFVDLDAGDETAGTEIWTNQGTLDDFERSGAPSVVEIDGGTAVMFNGPGGDAYRCFEETPAGLIGLDPTRTIEAWVWNEVIATEETILSWSHRGGPAGTNMSFNYGSHELYGAIGHWDTPDIGWRNVPNQAPRAGQWHHLVYTYDGTTTRVYSDGELFNEEVLGPGRINTHPDGRIVLAQQHLADSIGFELGLGGTLAIGRVRIHDGVLTQPEIQHNFEEETADFTVQDEAPAFVGAPADDFIYDSDTVYSRGLSVDAFPEADVTVVAPAGAAVTVNGGGVTVRYDVPAPPPANFTVTLRATNRAGDATASWVVTVRPEPGAGDPLQVAGELFVDLDAADPSAGGETWENNGTLGDFVVVGAPVVVDHEGAPAVAFNSDVPNDAYVCTEAAPAGLVGLNPTRTIEAWVLNPAIEIEETIVSWGHRGGPAGTNMSFNYGSHELYGAIGHWDAPDIGWRNVPNQAPKAGEWHHLVYTFDGTTTRVYADGELWNEEVLGPGVINTHADTAITVASQIEPDGVTLTGGLKGSLSIGRLRVHDEVLRPQQVAHNYSLERPDFPLPPPPEPEPLDAGPVHRYSFEGDATDSVGGADGIAFGDVTFEGGLAVLDNNGTQNSNGAGQSPPNDPPGAYIDLPNGIISALEDATFEAWVVWDGPAASNWQRIFDFGSSNEGEDFSSGGDNAFYLFLTPRSGAATTRFGYRRADILVGVEQNVNGPQLATGTLQHVVCTWDSATAETAIYINGERVGQGTSHFLLSEMIDDNNWLGRSQWADAMFDGAYEEFRIYDYPLTQGQVVGNFAAGPDRLNGIDPEGGGFVRGDADASGAINITDGIFILNFLFLGGGAPACADAADADNSGSINITDGIFVLNFLFLGGGAPAAPYPNCGEDPEGDGDGVSCATPHPNCV